MAPRWTTTAIALAAALLPGADAQSLKTERGNMLLEVDKGKMVLLKVGNAEYDVERAVADAAQIDEKLEGVNKMIATVQGSVEGVATAAVSGYVNENVQPTVDELTEGLAGLREQLGDVSGPQLQKKIAESNEEVTATIMKDVQKLVDAQAKTITELKTQTDTFAAIVELNKNPIKADVSDSKIIGPFSGGWYPKPQAWATVGGGRNIQIHEPGRYTLCANLRAQHLDNTAGFQKYRWRINYQTIGFSTTLLTEFDSGRDFTRMQQPATIYTNIYIEGPAHIELQAWSNAGTKRLGLRNDKDGVEELWYFYIPPGHPYSAYSRNYGRNLNFQTGDFKAAHGAWSFNFWRQGHYICFAVLRSYHGKNAGRGIIKLRNQQKGFIANSERMITQYEGGVPHTNFANQNVAMVFYHNNDISGTNRNFIHFKATANNIGLQADSNGYNQFLSYYVGDKTVINKDVGVLAQNPSTGFNGNVDFAVKKWANLNKFQWNLPSRGTYFLFCTCRAHFPKQGRAMVKLDVLEAEKDAKLLIPNQGALKYGKSVRLLGEWSKTPFQFSTSTVHWSWRVKVTGKLSVALQGQASTSNIGFKIDQEGSCDTIWMRSPAEELPPNLILPQ